MTCNHFFTIFMDSLVSVFLFWFDFWSSASSATVAVTRCPKHSLCVGFTLFDLHYMNPVCGHIQNQAQSQANAGSRVYPARLHPSTPACKWPINQNLSVFIGLRQLNECRLLLPLWAINPNKWCQKKGLADWHWRPVWPWRSEGWLGGGLLCQRGVL